MKSLCVPMYCFQCAQELQCLPSDFVGFASVSHWFNRRIGARVICTGCGPIEVDPLGRRVDTPVTIAPMIDHTPKHRR